MYTQIIYFLIVIFIFTTTPTDLPTFFGKYRLFAALLLQYLIFHIICRFGYKRALRKLGTNKLPPAVIIHLTEGFLNIVALVFLVVLTYGLHIQCLFPENTPFYSSVTLRALTGLALYFVYLIIIWLDGHALRVKCGNADLASWGYVREQIILYAGLLTPWLILSLASELLEETLFSGFSDYSWYEIIPIALTLSVFALFGPPLVVRVWRCKAIPFDEKRLILERFCRDKGFVVKDFLFWPLMGGRALTAAVVGFLPRWRYILITPALYRLLGNEELKAVIAHEMGHIKLRHMPFFLLFFLSFGVIMYGLGDLVFTFLSRSVFFVKLAFSQRPIKQLLFVLLCSMPALMILIAYFRYIFGYFLRNSERQADAYALVATGDPWPLIRSFQKIAVASGNTEDLPSWHHYSIRERIEFLTAAASNPEVIEGHDRRMNRSIKTFFVILGLFMLTTWVLQHTDWYRSRDIDMIITVLEGEVESPVERADIYAAYGAYLLEKKRYSEAERTLKRGVEIYPNHPDLCNNLAWLYATAPPPYRDTGKAVEYAIRAIELDSSKPHIWDTLAEAYFASGDYRKALEAIEQAIKLDPSSRYYQSQRLKILNRLKHQESQ
ncbi:M48 family metallopeptidase [Thermodesulforhabdus norvegica]|uniref:Zn-dependent protease with chaperone function n=1 Tax=Thermodesulforhabdus norvegica TaxID=39841 RepID=A0A1I4V8J1_9BACT|nr:M48 family metallopeptidase [Thermodesulforhabdus norvegica]SFM97475.1 Zn-dependent protease with chaperone function [Thermodesulforhabdus norvegica]